MQQRWPKSSLTQLASGQDWASWKTLRRYERWRKGDNLLMLAVMDGFQAAVRHVPATSALIRTIGLNLTDAAGPLKNRIARQAMGLAGDLPRLARAAG
jgi:2-octaprenylphenol hydroxylase